MPPRRRNAAQVPPLHTGAGGAQGVPFTQSPFSSQVCGTSPAHCDSPAWHPPVPPVPLLPALPEPPALPPDPPDPAAPPEPTEPAAPPSPASLFGVGLVRVDDVLLQPTAPIRAAKTRSLVCIKLFGKPDEGSRTKKEYTPSTACQRFERAGRLTCNTRRGPRCNHKSRCYGNT
jgi:hypothetical protein